MLMVTAEGWCLRQFVAQDNEIYNRNKRHGLKCVNGTKEHCKIIGN